MARQILVIGAGIAGPGDCGGAATPRPRRHRHRGALRHLVRRAGISIWPNALAALDEIGLGDAVRDSGGRVTAGALRWRDGTWLRRPARERLVKALGEPLVVIRRSALTEILADALADGTLHNGLAVRELVTTADGVRMRLSDSATWEADAVVGADGTRSVVARHLNGALSDRYVGYTAWRGVADCSLDPDVAGEVIGPCIEFGHVPLGLDRTYWFATERAPEGRVAPQGELTYLKTRFASWADPIPAVLAATDPGTSCTTTSTTATRPGSGRAGRYWWSATPRTRCVRTWARAVVRESRMPRSWLDSSTGTATSRRRSLGSWSSAVRGCGPWCVSPR